MAFPLKPHQPPGLPRPPQHCHPTHPRPGYHLHLLSGPSLSSVSSGLVHSPQAAAWPLRFRPCLFSVSPWPFISGQFLLQRSLLYPDRTSLSPEYTLFSQAFTSLHRLLCAPFPSFLHLANSCLPCRYQFRHHFCGIPSLDPRLRQEPLLHSHNDLRFSHDSLCLQSLLKGPAAPQGATHQGGFRLSHSVPDSQPQKPWISSYQVQREEGHAC